MLSCSALCNVSPRTSVRGVFLSVTSFASVWQPNANFTCLIGLAQLHVRQTRLDAFVLVLKVSQIIFKSIPSDCYKNTKYNTGGSFLLQYFWNGKKRRSGTLCRFIWQIYSISWVSDSEDGEIQNGKSQDPCSWNEPQTKPRRHRMHWWKHWLAHTLI